MVAWSCWHHTHTTVPDTVLTKQSNTHMQSRRLRHHVHFAYADCSIVGDPTPKPSLTRTHSLSTTTHTAQPYYSLPYLSHQHQHSHKHKQTKQWTPTTLTLSWQVNDALRKKKKNLPSTVFSSLHLSIKPIVHLLHPSNFLAVHPKVSRLGLTSIFCFVLQQPW